MARADRLGAAAALPVPRHRGGQYCPRPDFPRPGASRGAIDRAARLAGAVGFIEELPAGYDTRLGERGLRLSAGQRQRIALARAFLRDAPLLLLDEPAAHLDPASARLIGTALDTALADRTVILVSHGQGWAGAGSRVITLAQGGAPFRRVPVAWTERTAAEVPA